MKKIIAYALGQVYEKNKDNVDTSSIISYVDLKKEGATRPEEISEIDYDMIAVFSNAGFESMRRKLMYEYNVPVNKITSWRVLQKKKDESDIEVSVEFIKWLKDLPKAEVEKRKIIDVSEILRLYAYQTAIQEAVEEVFEHITDGDYVFLGRVNTLNLSTVEKMKKHGAHFLCYAHYTEADCLKFDENVFEIKKYHYPHHMIYEMCTKQSHNNIGIYVVTHKAYAIKCDDVYNPFGVGEYGKNVALSDFRKDNITHLNKKVNECTALYWIWKNTTEEIVGLNHYRRYFLNNEINMYDNILDGWRIRDYLENYDMLVADAIILNSKVIEQLKATMDRVAFEEAYELIYKYLQEEQPDYIEDFNAVMQGHYMFPYNMFVTTRGILNEYCEWLFSFLIPAAEEFEAEKYDAYSSRAIGFFAERMLTVWLHKKQLKVKELPILLTEEVGK